MTIPRTAVSRLKKEFLAQIILKILTFWDIHHKRGELFMEYQKASCLEVSGELCLHCKWNDWIGPKCNKISQPIPDPKNIMHYLDVF